MFCANLVYTFLVYDSGHSMWGDHRFPLVMGWTEGVISGFSGNVRGTNNSPLFTSRLGGALEGGGELVFTRALTA